MAKLNYPVGKITRNPAKINPQMRDTKHKRSNKGIRSHNRRLVLFFSSLLSCLKVGSSQPVNSSPSRRTLQQLTVNYYSQPELEWMVRLDEEMIQGNAVVQSPFDQDILYVVTHSGTLIVLAAKDGEALATVNPTPRSLTDNGQVYNWSLYSNSGIAFGKTLSGENFLVYSIVDDPPEMTDFVFEPKTRVIAVSIPSHKILWNSAPLPGSPIGSPLLYVNQNDASNKRNYVFLTHNSKISKDGVTIQSGHMTLLSAENGYVVFTNSEWERELPPRGFGPASVVTNPLRGMYSGGMQNSNDMVVWASNDAEGRGTAGHTFAFQLPETFSETTNDVTTLKVEVLKGVSWNAVTRPVLSRNGTNMFFGVTGNQLRGWIGNARFDQAADWSAQLFDDVLDPKAPIPATPVLSNDESRLFASSTSFDLASINTLSGNANWKVSGTSAFLSEARVSPDDKRIYVAQSADGRIFCLDQFSGNILWQGSCDQFEEDCSNSVRADFDLSSTGQFLYFSDVKGRLIALKLGDVVELPEPTSAPVWSGPFLPTNDIDWANDQGQGGPNEESGMGGTITLIVLATLVALASTMYIAMVNRRKRAPHPMQEPSPETDEYDPNGPDPYEDSMIIQHAHKQIRVGEFSDEFNPLSGSFDSDGSSSIHVTNFPPSDRMSVLMGTANRIAPLREDFSYGASVLV